MTKKEKRVSYAVSFGVSEIDDKIGQERKDDFMNFKAISVRENEGKSIIEKYTDRTDVQVLVDPTNKCILVHDSYADFAKLSPSEFCFQRHHNSS